MKHTRKIPVRGHFPPGWKGKIRGKLKKLYPPPSLTFKQPRFPEVNDVKRYEPKATGVLSAEAQWVKDNGH